MGVCVGIDVAKHSLEWSLGSEGAIEHARNEPRPIVGLVRRLVALDPKRIIVESTGGSERRLVAKLAEAGLPVVVVNPNRVRRFGQGMGVPAKTDALNARLLAQFGEKVEPPIRPILQGRDRLLADLVARRRQLVALVGQPASALGGVPQPGHLTRGPVDGQVVGSLQVEPELRAGVESLSEKPGRFGRDSALAADQFIDPLNRDAEMLGECNLGLAQRDQKLLAEDLARVGGNAVLRLHGYPLW